MSPDLISGQTIADFPSQPAERECPLWVESGHSQSSAAIEAATVRFGWKADVQKFAVSIDRERHSGDSPRLQSKQRILRCVEMDCLSSFKTEMERPKYPPGDTVRHNDA